MQNRTSPPAKPKTLTPYENWFYHSRDTNRMPYGTNMLYAVCDNDQNRFQEAERIIQAAFEAGLQAGLNRETPG